ncbi:centromere protein P [Oncorhynchus mykiss]|uniref:Centromere protein P n=1 Tax=Oncorhynchus mykiss TaxID=8022 RepID=A0A8C7LTY8_ONCMY|nr:centromere protein P [Oncorhynchus mykiss]XP_021466475.2 centromere protein P [Oncorhynchus mykiss]
MKKNLENVYEAQIKALQEEIAALQCQQDKNEREIAMNLAGGRMQDALLIMTGHQEKEMGKSQRHITAHLKTEIMEMEEDLIRQTKINGIVLVNCSVKTVEKGNKKMVQQHRLTGHCSFLDFQVEFELTDVQEDTTLVRTITDLNIVMDSTEFKDFGNFVSGVEDKRDLLLFFRTLRRFSDRCEDRRRTFQHFQEKYPCVVSLPGGCRAEVMQIKSPKLAGCALTIYWSIEVTNEGDITPKIDLLTKMPEKVLEMDSRKVIENAPDSFQSLLRILGAEASIDTVIQSVDV